MKLLHLAIDRLPGIDQPFAIEAIGDGIQIVHGPNGIGKSSLGRALKSILWAELQHEQRVSTTGTFADGDDHWKAERDGSSVVWQKNGAPSTSPTLPAAHLRHCFFLNLTDLLNASDPGVRELSAEIQQQMSGGYDLADAKRTVFPTLSNRHGSNQQKDFRRITDAIEIAARGQQELQRESDNLAELETRIDQAELAESRMRDVDLAKEVATNTGEIANLRRAIGELPDGLDGLSGDEETQIKQLRTDLAEKVEKRAAHERALSEAEHSRVDARLDQPIDPIMLDEWPDRETGLQQVENRLDTAVTNKEQAQANLLATQQAVGRTDVTINDALDLPHTRTLLQFLTKSQKLESHMNVIRDRIELLKSRNTDSDADDEYGEALEGRRLLLGWLSASRGQQPVATGNLTKYLRIAGILAILVGGLATIVHVLFSAVAGVGLGLLIASLFTTNRRVGHDYRLDAQQAFTKLALDAPAKWNEVEVEDLLRKLDAQLNESQARKDRIRDRGVERAQLEQELSSVEREWEGIEEERTVLFAHLSIDLFMSDAELVDLVRAVGELRKAKASYETASAELDRLSALNGKQLAYFNDTVSEFGVDANAKDSTMVSSRLTSLRKRNSQLIQAGVSRDRALEGIAEIDEQISNVNQNLRAIYQKGGVDEGDDAALRLKLQSLPEFQTLAENIQELDPVVRESARKIQAGANSDLIGLTVDELVHEGDRLQSITSTLDVLTDQRSRTKASVETSMAGKDVENLIADRDNCMVDLEDKRDEALWSTAGEFLIGLVENEHQRKQTPRVFNQANELFAMFTGNRYVLVAPEGTDLVLRARDVITGNVKALDQLSDGTRTQLLLAAKMAYAKDIERGTAMPLFLDEALVQSDPERYEAIIKNLGQVVSEMDCQVFYLTCDPQEVSRLSAILSASGYDQPGEIDVASARAVDYQVRELSDLDTVSMPEIPQPGTLSAAEYAVQLGVPKFDPSRGHNAQHLIYLMWDDLDLLHSLLKFNQQSVGQWVQLAGSQLAIDLAVESKNVESLGERVQLLDLFCRLWAQGRGAAIDRSVLETSQVITPRYIDPLSAICREHGGSAKVLLEIAESREDDRLHGIRQNSVARLRDYLIEGGFIDQRSILTRDAIVTEILASKPSAMYAEVAVEFGNRWCDLSGLSA
mgnify:CR=1 FL=1|jgi:uncharacterized protein YhaN|tara:strand:- start:410 stop:3892 length:3483 start_codon:yes stop_codon:yes gene_type:complete